MYFTYHQGNIYNSLISSLNINWIKLWRLKYLLLLAFYLNWPQALGIIINTVGHNQDTSNQTTLPMCTQSVGPTRPQNDLANETTSPVRTMTSEVPLNAKTFCLQYLHVYTLQHKKLDTFEIRNQLHFQCRFVSLSKLHIYEKYIIISVIDTS